MPAPILIIFGITGDLSKRKLLPALYHLFSQQLLPADTTILGVSRRELDIDELLGSVELCVLERDNICDPIGLKQLRTALQGWKLDPAEAADFESLRAKLAELNGDGSREQLFYMSIPPTAYAPIVVQLAAVGLNSANTRLLLEKPFGHDLASAESLVQLVHEHYSEAQIYRIDHYLAKETAQNLLAFRLYNPVFSALWNNEHIDEVRIRAYEKIGIEGRASFYEGTGALRDLIQSHLLQLLAITLMDVPAELTSQEIHRNKQYFLEQLKPADPARAVRAQYDSYRTEVGDPHSQTETFARVCLSHEAERWSGVNFVLETGKALAEKSTQIIVSFKTPDGHPSNNLVFKLQPDEGISFDVIVKQPGLDVSMQQTALDFDYQTAFPTAMTLDAYERVLLDALRADQALFASADEVLSTWRVLQPVLDDWAAGRSQLQQYASGATPSLVQ